MIDISLGMLGTFNLTIDGKAINRFRTNRVPALLAYLATESGYGERVQRRDTLTKLLWTGMPISSARQNLRQTLYELRKLIPDTVDNPFIIANRQTIQINPDFPLGVDTICFSELSAHHPDYWSAAIDLYRGDFLMDTHLPDAERFEEWAADRRANYRRQLLDMLTSLIDIRIGSGIYSEAIWLAQRNLSIDPLRESAYQQLMRALAMSGRHSEALQQYEICQTRLAEHLSTSVSQEMAQLALDIRQKSFLSTKRLQSQLNGYELKEIIGSGNFGTVYRGIQKRIGREVAIKIIREKYANDPYFIQRFESEANIIAQLEHPHIVPLYDFWREPGRAYLVMRRLRGGNLAERLNGGWSLARALPLVQQIAQALQAAHERDIIHRDIKAANILLDEEGNAYLSDFGIALAVNGARQIRLPVEMMVSAETPSPEQIANRPLTPMTDIYSFGVLLYQLLTGRQPFADVPPARRVEMHLNEPLPSVLAGRADLPAAVDAVIQTATAKKPERRYQTPMALARAFKNAVGQDVKGFSISLPTQSKITNPYKGLQAFGEADAGLFFGRDELIQQLAEKISQHRFLAVVGPSGSGKSSVVRAGLIPALRAGAGEKSENWFVTTMQPGEHPFEELKNALLRVAVDGSDEFLHQLRAGDRGLVTAVKGMLPAGTGRQLLLVIDQFEELFTLVEDSAETQTFLHLLHTAVTDDHTPIRVLITLRADFYDRPLLFDGFSDLMKAYTEVITPLNITELTAVIRQPAALAGVTVEPGLVTTLIADVRQQPGSLPLLQYALTELFEKREANSLTLAQYRQLGGVLEALARRADHLFKTFDINEQHAVKQLFLRLVTLGEGVEDTRRRVLQNELETLFVDSPTLNGNSQLLSNILSTFGAARLLSFDRDPVTRLPTVEVAHESLLREWERLRKWLHESRDDVRRQRLLARAANQWEKSGKQGGYLLQGGRLSEYEPWAEYNKAKTLTVNLTELEYEFLTSSITAHQQSNAEEVARQQRELKQAQQLAEAEHLRAEEQFQATQRLRFRAYLLMSALVMAALLAGLSFYNGNRANRNADAAQVNLELATTREAEAVDNFNLSVTQEARAQTNAELAATRESEAVVAQNKAQEEAEIRAAAQALAEEQALLATARELAARSKEILSDDAELGTLLAIESLESFFTRDGETALHRALQVNRLRERFTLQSGFPTLVNGKDGFQLAIFHDSLASEEDAFEEGMTVWDIESKAILFQSPFSDIIAWQADGSRWIIGQCVSDENTICDPIVFDAATGKQIAEPLLTAQIEIDYEIINLFEYTPDLEYLVWGKIDGQIEIEPVGRPEERVILSGHQSPVDGIGFDLSGDLMVTSEVAGKIIVWDIAGTIRQGEVEKVAEWEAGEGSVFSDETIFQTENRTLVVLGEGDGEATTTTVSIWMLENGEAMKISQSPPHSNRIRDFALSSDASLLATGSSDGEIKIVDIESGEEKLSLTGSRVSVVEVAFIDDDDTLMSVSISGEVIIWDATPIHHETQAIAQVPIALRAAISPDDRLLAVGNAFGPLTVFDVESGDLVFQIEDSVSGVRVARFSPDGSMFASGGYDGFIRLWSSSSGELIREWQAYEVAGDVDAGRFWPGIWDVAFSPDGTLLASGASDEFAKIWNVGSGELIQTLSDTKRRRIWRVLFSPDGKQIAVNDNEQTHVFDVESGKKLWQAGVASGLGLAYSHDGKFLAATGNLGSFFVWNADSGEIAYETPALIGFVQSVVFTHDDKLMLTADDSNVSVWDAETGAFLYELTNYAVGELAITKDGRLFVAEFATGHVAEYTLYLEDALALARERLIRELTLEECRRYLHSESCPDRKIGE